MTQKTNSAGESTAVRRKRIRRKFGRIREVIDMPNLIEVQRSSYDLFLNSGRGESPEDGVGLQGVFQSVFPIADYNAVAQLGFKSYVLEPPKFDVDDCQQRDMTYAAPLKVKLQLIAFDVDEETEQRTIKDIKEQDVFMGEIPLMTENGTFVIKGTERVVVSQMHRSPGVFFDHDKGKSHSSGKLLFNCRIIPYRGSWLDFEFDAKDFVHTRIDRRRKMPVTTLLLALGLNQEEILSKFYDTVQYTLINDADDEAMIFSSESLEQIDGKVLAEDIVDEKTGRTLAKMGDQLTATWAESEEGDQELVGGTVHELIEQGIVAYPVLSVYKDQIRWRTNFFPDRFVNTKPAFDLVDADSGEVLWQEQKKVSMAAVRRWKKNNASSEIEVPFNQIEGRFLAEDIIDEQTGLVWMEAGDELTAVWQETEQGRAELVGGTLFDLIKRGIKEIPVLDIDGVNVGPYIRNTLVSDKNQTREDALLDIYRMLRPGDPPVLDAAEILFDQLFRSEDSYDLSAVGRVKMNMRLRLGVEDSVRTLGNDDIVSCVKALVEIRDGKGEVDDIDHLGNRRVRSVGELMENQYRLGLLRMARQIKERMASVEIGNVMPQDLINSKPAAAVVREFFGSSQLSQFMDQTNPLSEVTHKRRLSALGPGGLSRERAGFEVRDVHPTHYGRICPIETPEGPNIGLINSLATFSRVNKYGFIESPYRKVKNGLVTDEVVYISATEEMDHTIAQANAKMTPDGKLANDIVSTRSRGEYKMSRREEVDMIDVSPKQLVSVAASLIPFLENDDANRALMGSNMQRQAVPLLRAEAPFVGTGIEAVVARDSGAAITARRAGIVDQVDATRIVIRVTEALGRGESGVDIYRLRKFQRSNQNTCINQRPLVNVNDRVERDEVIADGPSTDLGELALGRNVLVAFMPWSGYNFEDSVLISERIARDDVFTSVHIDEFEVDARDTKLGQEEITREIPNVGEEALTNLDEAGIVYIGAKVKPGDILVGKITPKGDSPMTAEDKLLRAIFGENASDVRDTSLRVPAGDFGTVVEVRVFGRHGIEKDDRAEQIEREEIMRLIRDRDDEKAILDRSVYGRLKELLIGKTASKGPKGMAGCTEITEEVLERFARGRWWQIALEDDDAATAAEALHEQFKSQNKAMESRFLDKVEKIKRGDDLPPGVMNKVKVFVAVKRKLQPGDKMAGRHGNKGVVSKVVPMEDMPFLEDGTPVDIVLNPLGVPSRMNVGQILETHMGWAARGLGKSITDSLAVFSQSEDSKPLWNAMRTAFGEEVWDEEIKHLSDQQLVEAAKNVANGVPIATPVFDGAKEQDVNEALQRAGFHESGQSNLYDGRTGEKFARPVTVGMKYLLKLHHLVDDKIHARSTGPYSLVTQQPLGGKAQFGGQRFGEMEVWALEAYGAAYTLQEMLTVKADDVTGRTKVYESIVKGEDRFQSGVPESFNVLVKEVRGLALNMELVQNDDV